MVSCRFDANRFDPINKLTERFGTVVIEAQHKAAINLDAVVMKDLHPAGVVSNSRRFLPGRLEDLVVERLEVDEHTGAAGEGQQKCKNRKNDIIFRVNLKLTTTDVC